jgi:hypothetical protein
MRRKEPILSLPKDFDDYSDFVYNGQAQTKWQ